jgi:integrase
MAERSVHKRCGCRNRQTGRPLGRRCPSLHRKGGGWSTTHGSWHYQLELPPTLDNRRRQLRRGGFDTRDDALADRNHARALLSAAGASAHARVEVADLLQQYRSGTPLPQIDTIRQRVKAGLSAAGVPRLADYLRDWLTGLAVEPNTRSGYESYTRLYLIPYLGHLPLDELKVGHIKAMYAALDRRNAGILAARTSGDPTTRVQVRGKRTLSPTTYQRIRGVLRAALNDAIAEELITTNPARHVKIPSRRPKPREWTPERVAAWRTTGYIPSPVMIWVPTQTGQFLDHAVDDDLYPLFHLIAFRGLRRGEACGLRRCDLDLSRARLTVANQITQHGWTPVQKKPKSRAGDRVIALDDATIEILKAHLRRQDTLARRLGLTWHHSGLVFTRPDGQPLHPQTVTRRFQTLVAEADMPPIRLHDLRHVAASIAHAGGADIKSISKLLGHSTIAVTADTYTEVFSEVDRAQAAASAAVVPLTRRRTA